MDPPSLDREVIARRIENAVVAVLCILSLVLVLLRVLSHSPFYDETLHIRFLWLLFKGLKPEADYFCQYPALAYIVALPYIKLFPDSPYVILALRGLSVVICCLMGLLYFRHGRNVAGSGAVGLLPFLLIIAVPDFGAFMAEYSIDHLAALTAIWAMTLFFHAPRPTRVGLVCGLSVLSVAITPKYIVPLFFGLLAYVIAAIVSSDWRRKGALVVAVVVGGLSALALVALLYRLANVSLLDNLHYAHFLTARYQLAQSSDDKLSLSKVFVTFISRRLLVTIALMAGLACWAVRTKRQGFVASLPGAGIIFGMALFALAARKNLCMVQYMTPMLFSAALFTPYAFPTCELSKFRLLRWLRWAMPVAVTVAISIQFFEIPGEFRKTPWNMKSSEADFGYLVMGPPMLKMISYYDACLRYIPPGERVVAAGKYHPLLRRDLTWVTFDTPEGLENYLANDDPARKLFAPEAFHKALEEHPPAYIVLAELTRYYPQDWCRVCIDFLVRHQSSYLPFRIDSNNANVWLRRDLVPDPKAAAARFRNVVDIEFTNPDDLIKIGLQLSAAGLTQEAITKYEMALKIEPDSALAHYSLALILRDTGRMQEAEEHLRKALQNCPEDERGQVQACLAQLLAREGKTD
jgi:tetratricopeptide (TPR) repeat protein